MAPPSRKIKATGLPQQIFIEEILARLPVKSLLKFRCVSKSWCSLIGSKRFMKAHLRHSIKPSRFPHDWIFFDTFEGLKQCPLPSLCHKPITNPIKCDLGGFDWKLISVVGSCNGLVCVLIDSKKFMLWNPATKKFKNLPDFDDKLSFDSITTRGFGFDELNDDYKVIGVVHFCVDGALHHYIGKVYSLRANAWKVIEATSVYTLMTNIVVKKESPYNEAGKFASGKLHWYGNKCDIVSFDLNSHVCREVELPRYTEGRLMGVVGGCLSAHMFHPNNDLDIWVMKEYGVKESWNKVVSVRNCSELGNYSVLNPLAVLPNGEVLVMYGLTFLIYNPKFDAFRQPRVNGYTRFFYMGGYIESLASVASDAEQELSIWGLRQRSNPSNTL